MATELVRNNNGTQAWLGLAATEEGDPLKLPKGASLSAIHALSGGGSGFNGGTITIQGTVNGSDWFTLKNAPGGDNVTFTADGYVELSSGAAAIRAVAGAGVSNVDVHVAVVTG